MNYRIMMGATLFAATAMMNGTCMAAGAIALGQPSDISKDGVAIFTQVNSADTERAKEGALTGCRTLPRASSTAVALCKIVATFENQCLADAMDPQDGTPGFGWALASNSSEAKAQAISNCRDTAGPTRQDACVIGPQDLWCDGYAK